MQKNKTTNGFGSGLNLDYNPLQTPNTVMTNALNATLLTMNGNELTLQNDMGNGRVETAYLPEGYIPLGTAELGGIIYIVSYNPLTNKSLIGSFPSPERNITSKEDGGTNDSLNEQDFYSDATNYIISTPYKRLDITDYELNPGDKYLIYCSDFDNSILSEENPLNYISAYGETADFNPRLLPRYIRFSIVSVASNGQVVDMTDSCVWLPLAIYNEEGEKLEENGGYYFMSNLNPTTIDGNTNLDDYRSLVTSNYNVFGCKSSGKLGILAQLECISSFEITWDAIKEDDTWKFYFFTNWTYENDVEPDKINLYGLYVESKIDDEITNDLPAKDIVISQYPYSVKSLLTRAVIKTDEQLEPGIVDLSPYADLIPSTGIPSINFPMRQLSGVELVSTDIMTHQSIIEGTDEYNFQFHNPKYIDSLSYIYDKYIEETTDEESDEESDEDPFAKYIGEYYKSGEKLLRKNDGSDNQFLISTPITTDRTEGILTLEISPTMPYGKLAWLKQIFNIDLSKLGTGEIDLVEYRYYILNNGIILSWGLDAYPERNKKINSVDFNFYEINSNYNEKIEKEEGIIGWIVDNQNYIDDYKVIDGKWTDGTECTELPDVDADYSFTVTGKSSYSGHFEESLNIYEEGEQDNVLIQNKVYLLLIDIDYSGKHIYYYRIFYTEPIFNSCYYKDEYIDYANIDLNEKLTLSFNISDILQNVSENEIKIYEGEEKEENEIEEIPSYKLDLSYDEIEYKIKHFYEETVTFKVDATVGYDSFKVDCDFEGKTATCTTGANPEDLNKEPMYNTGISSRIITTSVDPMCEPTFEDSNNKVTINGDIFTLNGFIVDVVCPVVIIYDKQTSANVEYELQNPTCTTYNIVGDGGKKTVAIRIDKYLSSTYISSDWSLHQNETFSRISIDTTGNINDTINNALNNYDFVCIGGAMTDGGDRHPWGVAWGYGSVRTVHIDSPQVDESNGHAYYYLDLWYSNLNNNNYNGMILFYATKYSNSVLLFTYLLNHRYSTEWFNSGKKTVLYDNLNNYGAALYSHGFSISDITEAGMINEDVAKAPFVNLYKPVSSANTWTIYEWSVISYSHDYFENYYANIHIEKVDISLTINNDCTVKSDLAVKNLHYLSPANCNVVYNESRRINNQSIIDNVSNSSDQHLVIYKDSSGKEQLLNLAVSPNDVYIYKDGTFSVAKYLYNINNTDSALEIRCSDGLIRALKFTGDTINAVWAYDDQAVAIENVCLIK